MTIDEALTVIANLSLSETQQLIANPILKEISARLVFLKDVGLNYLSLARPAATLSGGGRNA